jgi:two-component system, sensor histidine kinase LadS
MLRLILLVFGGWLSLGVNALQAAPALPAAPAVIELRGAEPPLGLGPHWEVLAAPRAAAPRPWQWALARPAAAWEAPTDSYYRSLPRPATEYWLRCRVQATDSTPWLLALMLSSPQTYDVFLVTARGHLVRHWPLAPTDTPGGPFSIRGGRYLADLPLRPGTPYTLLVRTKAGAVWSGVWPRPAMDDHLTVVYVAAGLYFGLLVGLSLFNLLLFFSIRDRAYLYYVGFTVSFGLLQLLMMSLWGQVFGWAFFVDTHPGLYYLLLVLTMLLSISTMRTFLDTPQRLPRVDGWLRAGYGVALVPLAAWGLPCAAVTARRATCWRAGAC